MPACQRFAIRIVDLHRSILGQNVAGLRRIAYGNDLQVVQVNILLRYALNVVGRNGRDFLRVSVPVVGRQIIKLLQDDVL